MLGGAICIPAGTGSRAWHVSQKNTEAWALRVARVTQSEIVRPFTPPTSGARGESSRCGKSVEKRVGAGCFGRTDMHRALGLLLLATEGALAQSREPSDWDDKVPGYSSQAISWTYNGAKVTCPCNFTAHVCNVSNEPSMTQTHTSTLQVNWNSKPAVKFAYLTDEYGTIISYMDGGWDNPDLDVESARIMNFRWDSKNNSNKQPARLVPHIVYEESCADVTSSAPPYLTWVRQAPLAPTPPGRAARTHALQHARATMAASASDLCAPTISVPASLTQRHLSLPSQRTQLALLSEKYDAQSPSPIRPPGRAL